ncbi:MAG: hypothetical protein IT425_05590 [Pirellulales bacterium]|nr:hypothetical protein [Pirellulales bacterium]
MRVTKVLVYGEAGWPGVCLDSLSGRLTAICGPSNSGKSTLAALMGHLLFGKLACCESGLSIPEGEILVEGDGGRYRLRRTRDPRLGLRLTIATLDHSAVDHRTTQRLAGNLTPSVLAPLCAVGFHHSPDVRELLSKEFAHGFQSIHQDGGPHVSRRVADLAARRDHLAHELESRLADERRASGELETRWRELDRLAREQQERHDALHDRLAAVEKSLAETDARLRYRRLELNVELRWQADDEQLQPTTPLIELDAQIEHARQMLGELAAREGAVRNRLSQVQTARSGPAAIADQQTWLAVCKQLAADLSGEISRLARATASQHCMCREAHPRLRPIAETIERQLNLMEQCIQDQRCALSATELQGELEGLVRTQLELRRHLEHLLARRHAHTWAARSAHEDSPDTRLGFSEADAEQLESRRMELEHERFGLVEQVSAAAIRLKTLHAELDTLERQRASLLSMRSIEHIQHDLAAAQRELETAAGGPLHADRTIVSGEQHYRASDFLAQLTNGNLVRLMLIGQGREAHVVSREGATIPVDRLSAAEHDLVYISLCLSLHTAASRQGVWLPLVLDEPFERLDSSSAGALVAVLDGFCRHGHQVFVFTRRQQAIERLSSMGADVRGMASLRQWPSECKTAAWSATHHATAGGARSGRVHPNAELQAIGQSEFDETWVADAVSGPHESQGPSVPYEVASQQPRKKRTIRRAVRRSDVRPRATTNQQADRKPDQIDAA